MTAQLSSPEPLELRHVVEAFDCGQSSLDNWLKRRAWTNQLTGASRTFVVCREQRVLAYYCLAAGSVTLGEAPGRLRRNMPDPVPMVVLGRLAVDQSLGRQGVGRALIGDAARRLIQASEIIGIHGVMVQALDDPAAAFYQACGFSISAHDPRLLMAVLQDLIAGSR